MKSLTIQTPENLTIAQTDTMRSFSIVQSSGKVSQSDLKIVEASANHPITAKIPLPEYEQQMRAVLLKIGVLYGIEKMPDGPRMAIFVQFMYDNFQRLTIPEIVLAAETNLKKAENRIESFGSLTVDFLTKLIGQYQLDKQNAIKAFNKAKTATIEPPKPKDTPEQLYNGLKLIFERTGQAPIGWDYSASFDWAWQNKLFTRSVDYMKAWHDDESRKIKAELTKQIASSSNFIERQSLEKKKDGTWVNQECRKRWMIMHFIEMFEK